MTERDSEDTTMSYALEEATHIVENNEHPAIETPNSGNEDSVLATNTSNNRKTIKTAAGVAVGGAAIVGASAAYMEINEDAQLGTVVQDNAEQSEEDTISIAAEEIELPELVVEALAQKLEGHENTNSSNTIKEEVISSSSDTIYAEVLEPRPDNTDQSLYAQTISENTVTAQPAAQSDDSLYGEDIPVVSVSSNGDSESDIQILGVTQDISTGYNVGHLNVDGEEIVVIDVDGDMVFDSMVADINHDGDITPDEIIDISQESFTLDDLNGQSNIFSDPLTGDAPDYLSDLGN